MATPSLPRRKAKTSQAAAANVPPCPPGFVTYFREIEGWARAQLIAVHCVYRTVDGLENDLTIGAAITGDHLEDAWAARAALATAVPKLRELWIRTRELAEQLERATEVQS